MASSNSTILLSLDPASLSLLGQLAKLVPLLEAQPSVAGELGRRYEAEATLAPARKELAALREQRNHAADALDRVTAERDALEQRLVIGQQQQTLLEGRHEAFFAQKFSDVALALDRMIALP